MSLKAKLVSSVAAFCLVLALLVVGILAVPSATINMGGSISFTATDVNATVTITVTGTETPVEQVTYTYDAEQGKATENWTSNNWVFDADREIVVTITVTNKDTVRQLDVAWTQPTDMTAQNVTVVSSGEASTTLDNSKTGAGSTNVATYKMTFTPKDENLAVEGATWTAKLVLSNHAGA